MAAVSVNAPEPAADSGAPEAVSSRPPIVIDLGKRSRKKIKRLRRGRGALMSEAGDIVAALREEGRVDGDAQVVILVVKQKTRRSKRLLGGLL